jgi:hypothetical protein
MKYPAITVNFSTQRLKTLIPILQKVVGKETLDEIELRHIQILLSRLNQQPEQSLTTYMDDATRGRLISI